MSSSTPSPRLTACPAPGTPRRAVASCSALLTPYRAAPTAALDRLARLAALGLGLGLGLFLLGTSACEPVGKGPEPEPVVDMSRAPDLVATPMCTAKNCAGCCLGDVCQPGITEAACGTAGAACGQCTGAQTCSSSTFTCGFDPNTMWLVAVTQGTFTTTNTAGMPWRSDGTMPQPLVQFDVANRTSATAIVVTGTAPNQVWTATWNQGFKYAAKDLLATGFDLQVLDKLSATMTAPMSSKRHVTLSQQDFATRNLTYQGWVGWEGVKTLSIVLQKQ